MTEVAQKRVVMNIDRCLSCRSCAAACHVSHARTSAIQSAVSGVARLPLLCRQCEAAPCVDACFVEAMFINENGMTARRAFRCTGCGSCATACPFGVIPTQLSGVPASYRSRDHLNGHLVAKCDLCADRTEGNRDVEPRCVAACPSGALMYVDERDAEKLDVTSIGARTMGANPFKRR